MTGVLDGIRVLDFGRFIAAPWCAALLADMGADVIRVEKREGGEDRWVNPVAPSGDGATFLQCNRNKRSVTLDSTTPEGQEIVAKLVAGADVVIANMPENALRSNALDYESLRAIKPDIILTSANAFGNGGPYSDRVGFDGVGQVMSGGVFRSGLPGQPMRSAVPWVDFGTAMNMALGTMMALFHRKATGLGQKVEVGLLPTALVMTNAMLVEQAITKPDRQPVGNRGQSTAPCDLFRVEDGFLLVQIVGQPMFKRWCRMIERPDFIDDPRFANDDARALNGDFLNDVMQKWCDSHDKTSAGAALDAARIPAAPLMSPQDALDDPHIQAMKFMQPVDYPGLTTPAPISTTPFELSLTPGSIRRRPPLLGEHTDEVMLELGYDATAIAGLRSREII